MRDAYDALLHWMSVLGEGSKGAMARALESVDAESGDTKGVGLILSKLTCLGHVNFEQGSGGRWSVEPPRLQRIWSEPVGAVLCGARTPGLVRELSEAAGRHGCELRTDPQVCAPRRILVLGSDSRLTMIAQDLRICLLRAATVQDVALVRSVPDVLASAKREEPMLNWCVESYDHLLTTWRPGALLGTAQQHRSKFNERRYYVEADGRLLRVDDRRTAVYCAAWGRGWALAEYDRKSRTVSVPRRAQLPTKLARIAIACSGWAPQVDGGRVLYPDMPLHVAASLMVAAGQQHPGFHMTECEVQAGRRPWLTL